jgi:flagellar biosynthesis repressor protein FlbT
MALKLKLKAQERVIISGAVIVNGENRSDFTVENNVPILREKDILNPQAADSPCKRIYLAIQLMYVDEAHITEHHRIYWELVRDVAGAAPSRTPLLREISEEILAGRYYQALKKSKKLIEYEQEAINRVRKSTQGL